MLQQEVFKFLFFYTILILNVCHVQNENHRDHPFFSAEHLESQINIPRKMDPQLYSEGNGIKEDNTFGFKKFEFLGIDVLKYLRKNYKFDSRFTVRLASPRIKLTTSPGWKKKKFEISIAKNPMQTEMVLSENAQEWKSVYENSVYCVHFQCNEFAFNLKKIYPSWLESNQYFVKLHSFQEEPNPIFLLIEIIIDPLGYSSNLRISPYSLSLNNSSEKYTPLSNKYIHKEIRLGILPSKAPQNFCTV
ncbi:hypothetical protein HMI54_002613 [Coelomomyces lativittatus]|nr:hypothetical protein HMI54_002613 [Coelomomyces lativittatus]